MVLPGKAVDFQLIDTFSGYCKARVIIRNELLKKFYQEAIYAQKAEAQTLGFSKGQTPTYYIEQNFKTNLSEHVKSFLFHYFVLSCLYHTLSEKKFILANDPELESMEMQPDDDAVFNFLLDTVDDIEPYDWKNMVFKAPQRKNYKDIDRQVESFIEQESQVSEAIGYEIGIGDWVCFTITLLTGQQEPLFHDHKEILWLRIGSEEVDREMQELLIGKKVGDSLISQARTLQEYFSDRIDTRYTFLIEIQRIVSHAFFSLENLKKHFGLKTAKDLHRKLIEVYSFRNDLSQRRETIEKLFKQLTSHYKFKLRDFLIEQQEKRVLEAVQQNPDYYVYKSEKNFKQTVQQLAEKQLKEAVIIDLISRDDKVKAGLDDVAHYLTLIQRPRTNMFVYFGMPSTKVRGQEMPISHALLEHICLREKTLNYIINTLTRKK